METAGIRFAAVIAGIVPYALSTAQYHRFAFDEMYAIALPADLDIESHPRPLQVVLPASRHRFITHVVTSPVE
jgi:hypothetical protein